MYIYILYIYIQLYYIILYYIYNIIYYVILYYIYIIYVIFKPVNYCYNKRILKKHNLVPRDISWIENCTTVHIYIYTDIDLQIDR